MTADRFIVTILLCLAVGAAGTALVSRALAQRAHELVVCKEAQYSGQLYATDCMQYDR